PMVGDRDAEAAGLARRRRRTAVGGDLQLDDDVRKDPGLLAGVERVVDGFLHAGQQGLARIVEAEEVPILGEELRDGDLALPGSHLDGRDWGLGCGSGGGLGRGGRGRLGCGRRRGRLWTTRLTARSGQWRSRWFAYTPHTNKIRCGDSSFPAARSARHQVNTPAPARLRGYRPWRTISIVRPWIRFVCR